MSSGHPTDADREAAARPLLAQALAALHAGDMGRFAGLMRDDATWLSSDGRFSGADAAGHARTFAASDRWWAEPQQKGAHAVLRWGSSEGDIPAAGALVLETRAGAIVLVCEVP